MVNYLYGGPNYLCFYEPHYEMFFIPMLLRVIAKLYLRMRGKKNRIDYIKIEKNLSLE